MDRLVVIVALTANKIQLRFRLLCKTRDERITKCKQVCQGRTELEGTVLKHVLRNCRSDSGRQRSDPLEDIISSW